jgi:hypothetical protein
MRMKTIVALIGLLVGIGSATATTLRPSVIVYGVIRDSYGLRLSPNSASVSAFLGTNEVARTAISIQPGGANYRLEVNVADPASAGTNDVVPGSTVVIRVRMGNVLQPTIGTNSFVAPGNGATVNRNLVLGVDTDGDGLPDSWEQMVIANSGGAINGLSQVGLGLDLDGDGMPDVQEFFYGSFAFLPGDQLQMNGLTAHANGRLSFSLWPVPGVSYSVETSPNVGTPAWAACPAALTETGTLTTTPFIGGDQPITIYIQPSGPAYFYRLKAK